MGSKVCDHANKWRDTQKTWKRPCRGVEKEASGKAGIAGIDPSEMRALEEARRAGIARAGGAGGREEGGGGDGEVELVTQVRNSECKCA